MMENKQEALVSPRRMQPIAVLVAATVQAGMLIYGGSEVSKPMVGLVTAAALCAISLIAASRSP